MIKLIIYGPTAVGKSELAIKLAKKINAEIISADSTQIYKGLDIGTAKQLDTKGVKHHLIDIINPDEEFNIFLFLKEYEKIMEHLIKENKNVIIVGGTALYIKALIDGLSNAPKSGIISKFLEKLHPDYIFEALEDVDYESYLKYKYNRRRAIRALEVFIVSGKKFSSFQKNYIKKENDFLKYYISLDRSELYKRINQRTDKMIKDGFLEEAISVYNKGYKLKNIIGYKQLFEYIEKKETLSRTIDLIKQFSRNYAKRQITWQKKLLFDTIDIEKIDPYTYIIEDLRNREIL